MFDPPALLSYMEIDMAEAWNAFWDWVFDIIVELEGD